VAPAAPRMRTGTLRCGSSVGRTITAGDSDETCAARAAVMRFIGCRLQIAAQNPGSEATSELAGALHPHGHDASISACRSSTADTWPAQDREHGTPGMRRDFSLPSTGWASEDDSDARWQRRKSLRTSGPDLSLLMANAFSHHYLRLALDSSQIVFELLEAP